MDLYLVFCLSPQNYNISAFTLRKKEDDDNGLKDFSALRSRAHEKGTAYIQLKENQCTKSFMEPKKQNLTD